MFTLDRRAETGSTNDDAAALLGDPAHAGRVIVADHQTAGRGRKQRRWIAPPGSALTFTAILPRPVPASALWAATLWTALQVAGGVEDAAHLDLDLQWPNDLLLRGRKCCGILCISRVAGDLAWIGCGVGLNVVRPHEANALAALAEIVPPPAFLSDAHEAAHAPAFDRDALLYAILTRFEAHLALLDRPGDVARAWERRARLAGTPYRLLIDGEPEPFDAVARRLSGDGSLVVNQNDTERTVSLADARVLREE